MKISDEDKELILKLDNIRQRGLYCSSNTLRDLYNRVFETNWKGTSCSSCMRQKISELMKALTKWESEKAKNAAKLVEKPTEVAVEENASEEAENNEVDNTPQEEKEAVTEQINDAQDDAEETEEEAEVADVTNNKVHDTQDVTENKEAEQQPPEITEEPNDADKRKSQPTKGRKKKSK